MTQEGRRIFFLFTALILLLGMMFLLRAILLPFVTSMAIAYFVDPVVVRLQNRGLPRIGATILITFMFFSLFGILLFFLLPIIGHEISNFLKSIPNLAQQLITRGEPLWQKAWSMLPPDDMDKIRNAAENYAVTIAQWVIHFFSNIIGRSMVLINILSLLFITPVVTFYLLCDWHKIVAKINLWLPRAHAPVIQKLCSEINQMLAAFVRGQATVCLSLGIFYGIALSSIGLELGLVVGCLSGLFSFVPYLGTTSGLIAASGIAIAQSSGWQLVAKVLGIYIAGNILEGYFLSPKLVGEKISLHPVWIIFALIAGGSLFGFLGILLALPIAAIIGVLMRFAMSRYLASEIHEGLDP